MAQELEKLWLRVTKQGNHYTFFTSRDGEIFLQLRFPMWDNTGLYKGDLARGDGLVKRIGLLANNGSRIRCLTYNLTPIRPTPEFARQM